MRCPARQRVERVEHPFPDAPRLDQHVGLERHPRLQRRRRAVSGGRLRVERDRHPVDRLVASAASPDAGRPGDRPASSAGLTVARETARNRARVVTELLVRIGVVAQQHSLPRPHEADRAARAVEARLEQRAGGHQRHQRLRCRDAAARGDPERGQRARLRGGDDDLALGLGLGELLLDLRRPGGRSRRAAAPRAAAPRPARPRAPAGCARASCAARSSVCSASRWSSAVLLRLAQVLLDDEVAVAELALPRQRRVGEIDPCPLQLELPLHLVELGGDHREPRGLRRDLRREERPVALPLGDAGCRAGRGAPAAPRPASPPTASRPPLGREHRERRAGGDLEPLLRIDLGQHARKAARRSGSAPARARAARSSRAFRVYSPKARSPITPATSTPTNAAISVYEGRGTRSTVPSQRSCCSATASGRKSGSSARSPLPKFRPRSRCARAPRS